MKNKGAAESTAQEKNGQEPNAEVKNELIILPSIKKTPSLEERMAKNEELLMLTERYKKAKDTLHRINNYKSGADKHNSRLHLMDGELDFKTSNTGLIEQIILVIREFAQKGTQDLEAEILAFEV